MLGAHPVSVDGAHATGLLALDWIRGLHTWITCTGLDTLDYTPGFYLARRLILSGGYIRTDISVIFSGVGLLRGFLAGVLNHLHEVRPNQWGYLGEDNRGLTGRSRYRSL